MSAEGPRGLSADRPYTFAEIAKVAKLPVFTVRRWILRAAKAQPDVGAVTSRSDPASPSGKRYIVDITRLREYRGWEQFGKRFLSRDESEALQARVREQDKQIQALRARCAATEREAKTNKAKLDWLVRTIERASGKKFADEAESGIRPV